MDRTRSPNDDAVDKIGRAQDRNNVPDSHRLWSLSMTALPYHASLHEQVSWEDQIERQCS